MKFNPEKSILNNSFLKKQKEIDKINVNIERETLSPEQYSDILNKRLDAFINGGNENLDLYSLEDFLEQNLEKDFSAYSVPEQIMFSYDLTGLALNSLHLNESIRETVQKISLFLEQNLKNKDISPLVKVLLTENISDIEKLNSYYKWEQGLSEKIPVGYSFDESTNTMISDTNNERYFYNNNDFYSIKNISKDYFSQNGHSLVKKEGDLKIPYFQVINKKELIDNTRIFHATNSLEILSKRFNLPFENMYLSEQIHFLDYLSGTKTENWNQLKQTFDNPEINNENVLRSFLSLDKGGVEMGQKILDIAEKIPAEQANTIFEQYAGIIDKTKNLSHSLTKHLDKSFDGESAEFVTQLSEALVTRAKDTILAAHHLIENVDRGGQNDVSLESYIHALEGFNLSLDIIENLGTDDSKYHYERKSQNQEVNRFMVSEGDTGFEYDVKFVTRPYAEARGKAQARMSMEISFDTEHPNEGLRDAYNQEITYFSNDTTKQGSSFRLAVDLDTKFDPDNPILSLDTGRGEFSGEKIARSGDSFGNALAKVSTSSSHMQETFNDKFSHPEVFAKIVSLVKNHVDKL